MTRRYLSIVGCPMRQFIRGEIFFQLDLEEILLRETEGRLLRKVNYYYRWEAAPSYTFYIHNRSESVFSKLDTEFRLSAGASDYDWVVIGGLIVLELWCRPIDYTFPTGDCRRQYRSASQPKRIKRRRKCNRQRNPSVPRPASATKPIVAVTFAVIETSIVGIQRGC
jgi:hypothetical protein